MNNDDDEDAQKAPFSPEVIIKQIGDASDGKLEFEIMESKSVNEPLNRNKKRKADTDNEDFFDTLNENEDEFSTRKQRDSSLEQNENNLESGSNKISGKSRVVIVRSKNDRKIFGNPNQCLSLLNESIFGKISVRNIEVRGNGRSIKFEIDDGDVTGLNLSNITRLGSVEVSVRSPLLDTYSVGVIGSFDLDLDLQEEVLPYLKAVGSESSIRIVEIERITNKQGKTEQVKVIFDGDLPKKLSLNGLIYRVRRYEFNPKRCFRCSLYGHSSDSCNKKIYCAFCGSNHFLAECQKKKDNDVPTCLNCKGDHVGCTNKCNYFQSAKKIKNKLIKSH